jgi:AbrB family looped-hinge helix DNA binding protein
MKSIVSERGQVTIPKRIRDRLGLYPGQEIEFEASNGLLIGKKKTETDVVISVTGIIKKIEVDEYLRETRGPDFEGEHDANGS